jgi:DNA-directed RNA polymerase subunit RPC12/RpoP
VEADLLAGMLRSHGLEVVVQDSETVNMALGYTHALGGVKVLVATAQVDEAAALMAATDVTSTTPVVCPNCGSTKVLDKARGILSIIFSAIFMLAPSNEGKMYQCATCKHRF